MSDQNVPLRRKIDFLANTLFKIGNIKVMRILYAKGPLSHSQVKDEGGRLKDRSLTLLGLISKEIDHKGVAQMDLTDKGKRLMEAIESLLEILDTTLPGED